MSGHATVGIDDDLAAGEAGIGVGPAQLEHAGGVGQDAEVAGVQLGGEQGSDHVIPEVGEQQGLEIHTRVVLGRDEHGLEGDRPAVLVGDADLGLAVRPQIRQHTHPAHLRQPLGQAMGQPDRERHQIGSLVAGVSEHHPLVAGTLGIEHVLAAGAGPDLEGVVHTLADVGRLLVEGNDHTAGVPIDAEGVVVVADVEDRLADQFGDVDIGRRW